MGDLFDSLVRDGGPMLYPRFHARRLIVMAIEAMADLRCAGFLHRDLKAENLLLNSNGQMLLGDIGNLKDLEGKKPEQVQTVLGSIGTMAPELESNMLNKTFKVCETAGYSWEQPRVYFTRLPHIIAGSLRLRKVGRVVARLHLLPIANRTKRF